MKFSQALAAGSPFAAREFIAGKDARTLARALLAMSQAEFSAVFKGLSMQRAKLRGLKRNAAVVLGNVGTTDDATVLEAVRSHEHDIVREHAEWARRRIDAHDKAGSRMDVASRSDSGERA